MLALPQLRAFISFLLVTTITVEAQTSGNGVIVLTGQGGASSSPTSSVASSSLTSSTAASITNSFSLLAASNTSSTTSSVSSTPSVIRLTGSSKSSSTLSVPVSLNGTISATSTAPVATNTQPCNNYVEFCSRKYSNLTQVCAHNSPFVMANNAAANQDFNVVTQLNDGIRMLQAQTHLVNGTLFLCHTSCSILNAGTLTAYLTQVASWVSSHPYDVITILIGNGDYSAVGNFTAPIADSGILPYVYTPPKNPMAKDDWPVLSQMILASSRVVIYMDYEANQGVVPYIIDEFSHLWETPFDPTDRTFPCTVERPPGLSEADARSRMYMVNHNLNTELTLLGNSILVPTVPLLNVTNAVNGSGSLGVSAEQCTADHGTPPNWLNVDYYNVGNGSVFEVAAKWNNVTYNMACCGHAVNSAERTIAGTASVMMALLVVLILI